ncbi:hypothetical protein C6P45_000417 [Maudiozyma exigua]|uniref:Ribosomal lysine N-methyltransferase 4 n=1 Tax=Maudiozyma exigua TaxID=34358 RepID=A0A9P6W8T5_MAUEX|nr:hypothetical protein C6P45_000417 [Kazachstania exigua]
MDQFDRDTKNFVGWLSDVAHVKQSPKIAVKDLRNSNEGRAVIATDDIDTDEKLFEIPFESLINIETSQINNDYPGIQEKLAELGQWNGLVICLLYEWEYLGQRSRWWPYMQVLPTSTTLNGLMYWDEEQLDNLKPSLVLERIGKEGAKRMYETVQAFVIENGMKDVLGNVSWDDFLRVASTIMSYSFDVEKTDENDEGEEDDENEQSASLKSMVPFADTLNADTHKCNAHLEYDKSSLKMCAIQPIKKGEQVYNIYGEHPNSEILRRYGYVELDGSVFDFGEVCMTNIKESLKNKFKVDDKFIDWILEALKDDEMIEKFFEDEEIVLDSYDCYISGEILTELVLFLQIITTFCIIPGITSEDEVNRRSLLARVTKKCIQLVENSMVTASCSDVSQLAIRNRLNEYPGDCIEYKPDFANEDDINKIREGMAKVVLKSECQALTVCLDSINKQYKIIDDQKLLNNIIKRKGEGDKDSKKSNKRQHR